MKDNSQNNTQLTEIRSERQINHVEDKKLRASYSTIKAEDRVAHINSIQNLNNLN